MARRSKRNKNSQRQSTYTPSRPEISPINPKTEKQRTLMEYILDKDVIIANGEAGCGKSFVTLYQAVQMLEHGWVDKILYIKPNVDFEGERGIGFLQGSVDEKMLPLFQPIMDNMKFCTKGKKMELLQQKKIEIGLLEYLRGRNLAKTFVILDEAQNTSVHAVKTVISRLEINDDSFSKIVITGDVGQCDTRDKLNNGLRYCLNNLHDLEEVGMVNFTREDNVRNPRLNRILSRFP